MRFKLYPGHFGSGALTLAVGGALSGCAEYETWGVDRSVCVDNEVRTEVDAFEGTSVDALVAASGLGSTTVAQADGGTMAVTSRFVRTGSAWEIRLDGEPNAMCEGRYPLLEVEGEWTVSAANLFDVTWSGLARTSSSALMLSGQVHDASVHLPEPSTTPDTPGEFWGFVSVSVGDGVTSGYAEQTWVQLDGDGEEQVSDVLQW